jgi:hypothetical protein
MMRGTAMGSRCKLCCRMLFAWAVSINGYCPRCWGWLFRGRG